jgi:REP-associated tyrosine transposase
VAKAPRDKKAGIFHVYTHCVYAAPALYRDDIDRIEFLRHLARVTGRHAWRCIAFCLMGTHYHLIVEVEDDVLPVAMHSLNLGYARGFNKRHRLKGHVLFEPYGAGRIRSDASLVARFRYVARNPVRAGLCKSAADWPWSSYPGTVGLTEPFSFVDAEPIVRLFADLSELRVDVEDL